MKTLKDGYLNFPDDYKSKILNGVKTSTRRAAKAGIVIGDILTCLDFEEKEFCRVEVIDIKPESETDVWLHFKVVK